jgi:hypothetical protein
MMTRFILVALLALPASPGGSPWDKTPEKWNLEDVSRILQDSPWSPAGVKLEREVTGRYADRQPGKWKHCESGSWHSDQPQQTATKCSA